MRIYASEAHDKLFDKINNNKIILSSKLEKKINFSKADKLDNDLYPLDCILVSTGWNKNDDVFDKQETFSAKATPKNKQLNYMHDDAIIIGHILDAKVIDRSGKDLDSPNTDFDIAISSVVYKHYRDENKQEIVKSIISDIESKSNKWFVSMECFFDDFDYALIDASGNQKIVTRAESSAWLSKYLRAYGGDGKYQNFKIGRLLKNITFCGVAIVDAPANPRSIIYDSVTPFNSQGFIKIEGNVMDEIKKAMDEALAANKSLAQEVDSLKAVSEEKDKALAEIQAALQAKVQELESVKAELQKIFAEKKMVERKSKLSKCNVEDARADELVKKFENASDEIFEEILKLASSASSSGSKVAEETTEIKVEKTEVTETTASLKNEENKEEEKLNEALASFVANIKKNAIRRGKK